MVALLRMKYTCVHPAEVNLKPLRESHTSRRTYCSIASWRNGLKLDLKVIVSVRVSYMRKLHYTRWTLPEICANFTELMSHIINPNVLAICTCELIRRNGISFVLGADQIFQLYLMRFVRQLVLIDCINGVSFWEVRKCETQINWNVCPSLWARKQISSINLSHASEDINFYLKHL